MTRAVSTIAMVLLLAAILGACGGDDEDATPVPTMALATLTPTTAPATATATGATEGGTTASPTTTELAQAAATGTTADGEPEPTSTGIFDPIRTPTEEAVEPTQPEETAEPTQPIDIVPTDTSEPSPTAEDPFGDDDPLDDNPLAREVNEQLLTVDDLPEGWTEVNREIPDDEDRYAICEAPPFPDQFLALAEVEVDFEVDEDEGPYLWHSIVVLPEGSGPEAMSFIREHSSCIEWTDDDVTYQAQVLDPPPLGEEAFATIVTLDTEEFGTAQIEYLFIRVEDTITVILYAELGELDPAESERFAQLALAKLDISQLIS